MVYGYGQYGVSKDNIKAKEYFKMVAEEGHPPVLSVVLYIDYYPMPHSLLYHIKGYRPDLFQLALFRWDMVLQQVRNLNPSQQNFQ